MLKRYAVFAYNQDPGDSGGGIADLKNAFHTREEAEKWVSEMEESDGWFDFSDVIDLYDTILFDKGVAR